MRLYLGGDQMAFQELYRRYSGRVMAFLVRRVGSKEEAQDIHQAVFMKFHQNRHQFDFKYQVSQYLFVIAKTAFIDHLRRDSKSATRDAELLNERNAEAAVSESAPAEPEIQWGALSARQRDAVKMRYLDEASYAEIAKKLGRSEQGVRQIVSRALKQLRFSGAKRGER